MAAPNVIDELIVTLNLDAEQYSRAERKVEQETGRTFRKQQERARQTDRTNRDQQKRLKDVAAGVKGFAMAVTGAVGVVTGLGVAVGGVLTGLLNFETGLRRQTVGTGLSNRQMQAWSATARRMRVDAQAGAEAMANLAREQKMGGITGNAPTMVALSRMGVNTGPGRELADILGDAQAIFRAAPAGQQQQIESTLLAQGVSGDLILMIKSEIDAREVYGKSLKQAMDENARASAAWADTLETLRSTGLKAAGVLRDSLAPAIERGAEKLVELAVELDNFATDVRDAGGGVNGFQQALDKNFPTIGYLFEGFRMLGDVLSGVVQGLKNLWNWLPAGGRSVQNFLNRSRAPWSNQPLGDALQGLSGRANTALFGGPNGENGAGIVGRSVSAVDDWLRKATAAPAALPRNIENDRPAAVGANAKDIMATLTGQYGLTVAQAAAVVANWQAESGLRGNAFNAEGGGTGARGLAQWRGARSQAFKQRYGVLPDQASTAQQIEFAMTDPYERALMLKSFAGGGDAAALGASYSRIYEAHGNVREDMQRGRAAGQLASGYGSTSTVNIQNMTVQTESPGGFVQGLQRIDTTQPYNTVVR